MEFSPESDMELNLESESLVGLQVDAADIVKQIDAGDCTMAKEANTNMNEATAVEYNRKNPYAATLVENYVLNKEGSDKDTRHFSIDLGDSGISYIPGDSLFVYAENDSALVEELLAATEHSLSKDEEIARFTSDVNLTRPSNKLFNLILEKTASACPPYNKSHNYTCAEQLHEKFSGYSVVALIKHFADVKFTTDDIANNSSKLLPRAYSIASSISAHPNKVELCVAVVDEEINGQPIKGVCSNYMAYRAPMNEAAMKVFVHKNDKFRLPEDPSVDVIMVGPGTGIAPFRAFIEERLFVNKQDSVAKPGMNWLFFGDRRKEYDYIYSNELEKYEADGQVKVSTAFSRDQEEKVYVQNKMQEHGDELYEAIKNGAYFYVCGDARRMAKDVDHTLKTILTAHGEDGEAYVKQMKEDKRYCRDVY